jgi:hypothetical protein
MASKATVQRKKRTRNQTLGVAAIVLLPVLVLIGLAASAAGSIARP